MGVKGVKERTARADSPQKTENDDELIFRGLVKRGSRKGLKIDFPGAIFVGTHTFDDATLAESS
jgi:hypothetical protein